MPYKKSIFIILIGVFALNFIFKQAHAETFADVVAWSTKAPTATKVNALTYIAGSLAMTWALERLPLICRNSAQCSEENVYAGQVFSSVISLSVLRTCKKASFNGQCVAHMAIPTLFGCSGMYAGVGLIDKMLLSVKNFVCWGCLPHLGGLAAVLLKTRILK